MVTPRVARARQSRLCGLQKGGTAMAIPQKHSAGAKAKVYFQRFSARLNSSVKETYF
jgi:hypothetical protein